MPRTFPPEAADKPRGRSFPRMGSLSRPARRATAHGRRRPRRASARAGRAARPPITGTALARASAAALEHTGGGRVTDTEAGDEGGAYEVEVTLADGSQVDVHLDAGFAVIGDEADRNEDESDPDED
jgi:hypothetical protein